MVRTLTGRYATHRRQPVQPEKENRRPVVTMPARIRLRHCLDSASTAGWWVRGCLLGLVLVSGGCAGIQPQQVEESYLDDEIITDRVQAALMKSLGASTSAIKVQTFKGVVLLSGRAPNGNVRERAVGITRDVEGVAFVKDKIEVPGH